MSRSLGFVASLSFAFALLWSSAAAAQGVADAERHYDARIDYNAAFIASQRVLPSQPNKAFVANLEEASVEADAASGAVNALTSQRGYLTDKASGAPMTLAMNFVRNNVAALGLEAADLQGYAVTDVVYSKVTGATHIYLQQRYRGIPVYNAQLQVNVNRDGRIISVNNSFLPGIARAVSSLSPRMQLPAAVGSAAQFSGTPLSAQPKALQAPRGMQVQSVEHAGISRSPINGKLMLLPIRQGEARLVWNFQIHTLDEEHSWDYTVDADTGQVWTRFDWVAGDQYRVYRQPAESPNHTSPLPPSDGRVLVVNPANTTASPFGWHDTNGAAGAEFTTTQGNNVQAYTDVDANNSPDANSSPSGGAALNFDFALNLAQAPSAYRPAAVTNLFYLNNFIHDVQYQYGFDEAGGNFQVNNYGRGGAGNDSVRAEAQDGAGTNNANFGTPPDGQRPRMQMFVWTSPNPDRDGDLDAGIVFHEYGHGISNRLVGGPANVNCLTNRQQPGEGLSDWWALAHTAEVGDTGADPRGMGTYALGQPTSGAGIRTQRYSTNPAVNTWTYASINGMAVPHGVGSVWAQAAWEVYWKLVDRSRLRSEPLQRQRQRRQSAHDAVRHRRPEEHRLQSDVHASARRHHPGGSRQPRRRRRLPDVGSVRGVRPRHERSQRRRQQHDTDERLQHSGVLPGRRRHGRVQRRLRSQPRLADESERHRHRDHRSVGARRSASHRPTTARSSSARRPAA